MTDPDLQISALRGAYQRGSLTPEQVIDVVYQRIEACPDPAVWIELLPREAALEVARALHAGRDAMGDLPLYGIPFAIKDNIDCAGFKTTAACPSFSYAPAFDAPVVARLRAAGAIAIGKTNMDQFATGLVGTRSPYGAPRCVFDDAYISGGSSSGSAVAVARGLVSFALGTDTAGSGRVPAGFNNIVGYKPTRGLLSTRGVVPACRSLDCVSIFAATSGDARAIADVAAGFDAEDPFSRPAEERPLAGERFRFGVPAAGGRAFFGDAGAARLYEAAIARLDALGGTPVEVDYGPLKEAASLLYSGPWVAERTAAVGAHIAKGGADLDPTVASIVSAGNSLSASETFEGQYRLAAYRRQMEGLWQQIDTLLLPTAPTIYRVDEVMADPVRLNANLGLYTNFVNLLDCAAVAVPAGFRDGLPFGVTLVGPAFTDRGLLSLADRLHRAQTGPLSWGATGQPPGAALADETGGVLLAVVGAHLSGQPLNHELTERGAKLVAATRTAPAYRLYALADTAPPKPGLFRDADQGVPIEVEVWALSHDAFGAFTALVPPPLGIGNVELAEGRWVKGFICEAMARETATDISAYGGWRPYLADKR